VIWRLSAAWLPYTLLPQIRLLRFFSSQESVHSWRHLTSFSYWHWHWRVSAVSVCQNNLLNLLGWNQCSHCRPSHCLFRLSSIFNTWATWRGWADARDSGEKSKHITSDGNHFFVSCSTAESKVISGFICCLIKKSRTGPICDSNSNVAWVLILIEFSGLWS